LYLFVYGTLLQDFNHKVRQEIEEHLQFISKATIKGALYDLNYPGYVEELLVTYKASYTLKFLMNTKVCLMMSLNTVERKSVNCRVAKT
jgi:gamma-glutamylcyclotransferase (GGCT)/AIG2-like uncharacterized protein YtfP